MRAIWAKKPVISRNEKIAVTKLLMRQLVIVFCVALILFVFWNKAAAISGLLGGLLLWFPSVLMAIFVFARSVYHDPKQIVKQFYVAELFKILLMVVLFVLVLHYVDVMLAPFLVGLISTYLAYIFV